ncbi:hypothetical protein KIN20_025664 [Parelaphostrongylus tenuis]|uniref:Uncharacterized protein n=1 Tax=Parelaphostrongylus tenuis TaxID=148309 RepID=A0AAD5N9K2_PARTN|nr:hypothetical protein KIN20_025664 [Parelaphostrongylus tenuis]
MPKKREEREAMTKTVQIAEPPHLELCIRIKKHIKKGTKESKDRCVSINAFGV